MVIRDNRSRDNESRLYCIIICCSYELNLSVQQSGFTVYRKHKPTTDDDKKVKVSIMKFKRSRSVYVDP